VGEATSLDRKSGEADLSRRAVEDLQFCGPFLEMCFNRARTPLEREPRHKLKLPHPRERTAEDIVDLAVPSAIDACVAGIGQVGMVESVLCLHFKFHR
jgi:hypothetical protein